MSASQLQDGFCGGSRAVGLSRAGVARGRSYRGNVTPACARGCLRLSLAAARFSGGISVPDARGPA